MHNRCRHIRETATDFQYCHDTGVCHRRITLLGWQNRRVLASRLAIKPHRCNLADLLDGCANLGEFCRLYLGGLSQFGHDAGLDVVA